MHTYYLLGLECCVFQLNGLKIVHILNRVIPPIPPAPPHTLLVSTGIQLPPYIKSSWSTGQGVSRELSKLILNETFNHVYFVFVHC